MTRAAGGKLDVADVLTATWQSYTPTWTASGSAPSIGNGSLSGAYCMIGNVVIYQGLLQAGSTTTFGSGTYSLSTPVTCATRFGSNGAVGMMWIRDSSSPGDFATVLFLASSTTLNARPASSSFGGSAVWGASNPMTMANGDWVTWSVNLEVA